MKGSYDWDSGKKVICVDFDGVLHDYTKKEWEGVNVVSGPPVDGAIKWLKSLVDNKQFIVKIYSYRSKFNNGHVAMRNWLKEHGVDENYLERIEFSFYKPVSFVTIDDRCICYNGKEHPSIEEIINFESWLE